MLRLLIGISAASLSSIALAAPPSPSPSPSAPAPTPAPKKASSPVLWDYWYVVTLDQKEPYLYYRERVETREGKWVYQTQSWKKEEDYINEEQLGVFAQKDEALTPLFFNFHSVFRTLETKIDGTVSGRHLTVKVRKGEMDLPIIKKVLAPGTFFSSFFSVWLGAQLPKLKEGKTLSFSTVFEDNLEVGFSSVQGRLRLDKPDTFAVKTSTQRITVDAQNLHTVWWVDAKGAAFRIENPVQKTVVERASENRARHFLD